jgi:glycosyltransferase involved in cell wall biosynthesis
MRIIQLITSPQPKEAEIFAAQLSTYLEEMGHSLLLVSIFKGHAELPFDGIKLHLSRPYSQRFIDWQGWQTFSLIVRDFEPDIIQAHGDDAMRFVSFSKKMYGWNKRTIFRNYSQLAEFQTGKWKKRLNQWLLNEIDGVISMCQNCEKEFLDTFAFPASNSIVVPLGIQVDALEQDSIFPREMPKRYLLQIGDFLPEKNHMDSLQVFSQLEDPNLQLIFLGEGPLLPNLKNKAKQLGIYDRVRFIGPLQDRIPYIKKAIALLMPSLVEGLPACILEAQFAQVPVIGYAVGGLPETVKNTGWLVKKGDVQGYFNSIQEVLALSPDEIAKITSPAKQLVMASKLFRHVAKSMENIYQHWIANGILKSTEKKAPKAYAIRNPQLHPVPMLYLKQRKLENK